VLTEPSSVRAPRTHGGELVHMPPNSVR